MMSLPRRLRVVVLGAVGVLAVLAALLADVNWLKPAVVHHLRQASQRDVRIDDLQLRFDEHWQPVVRLRGVQVANAAWAGPEPFIRAGEVSFTFEWSSVFGPVRRVTELRLVDAQVDLRRQADGLRNWRLTRPDDRGAARMRILRLRPERSSLRLVHEGVGLVLQATSSPLPAAQGELTQRVVFGGTLNGARFDGEALGGPVLSMVDTGETFAIRGEAHSRSTRLRLDGRLGDLTRFGLLDADTRVEGDTLADLKPFLPRTPWPVSKPYRFQARMTKHGQAWAAHDAHLLLGRSDVAGEASFEPRGERHVLVASARSQRLLLDDLPSQPAGQPVRPVTPVPPTKLLPRTPLPLGGLRKLDGRLTLDVAELRGPRWPPMGPLKARATLDQGRLDVQIDDGRLAGGTVHGRVALDARADTPRLDLALQGQGVQLAQLWPTLPRQAGLQWPALEGQVALRGQGASLAQWLGGVNGHVDLNLDGGTLSRKLDARLGLDAGGMLRSLLKGDAPVSIRCGAVSVAFANGVGTTRSLVLDTADTHVQGQGRVHLADETWAVLLTPQPQGRATLQLPNSLLAQGTFRGLAVKLAPRTDLDGGARTSCGP
jgi:AsmA family protein